MQLTNILIDDNNLARFSCLTQVLISFKNLYLHFCIVLEIVQLQHRTEAISFNTMLPIPITPTGQICIDPKHCTAPQPSETLSIKIPITNPPPKHRPVPACTTATGRFWRLSTNDWLWTRQFPVQKEGSHPKSPRNMRGNQKQHMLIGTVRPQPLHRLFSRKISLTIRLTCFAYRNYASSNLTIFWNNIDTFGFA